MHVPIHEASPPALRPRRLTLTNDLLERAWRRGWANRPTLDPDALVAIARRRTGLDDTGADDGWRTRLAILTGELEDGASLTALGRTIAHGQLTAALANRLRATALWARHPDILDRPIAAPIIVLGQMRSGSTRMQRLLACDPRLTYTRFFESWNPVHRTRLRRGFDDRWWRGALGLTCVRLLNPDFAAIHPTGVAAPDEEIGLQSLSVFGSAFEAQWRVPAFAAHGEQADARPAYATFKRLLQTLAWLRGRPEQRPWIIKVPQLSQDLDAVLATFPDARLVCLDRDADALVASSASLVHNQMRLQSHAVDPRWIGREWLRKVALREGRVAAARLRADVPQVDVAFADVGADWGGQMERVYRMLGMPLTAEVRARMARYVAGAGRRAQAPHRYSLAEFGLTSACVTSACVAAAYAQRQALAPVALAR